MVINENINTIVEAVEKQHRYLSSHHTNKKLEKENYSFSVSKFTEKLYVSLVTEEQSSGSCWNENLWEPKHFSILTYKVKRSIRIALSAILPKTRKSEINPIVHKIFEQMNVFNETNTEYYGNYTRNQHYEISIHKIFEIVKTHFNI